MNRKGGGAPFRIDISNLDRKIMSIVNLESVNGIMGTSDSGHAHIKMGTQLDISTMPDEAQAPATPATEENPAVVVAELVADASVTDTITPPVTPAVAIPRPSRPGSTMSEYALESTEILNAMRKTLDGLLTAQLASNQLAERNNQLLEELLRTRNDNNNI